MKALHRTLAISIAALVMLSATSFALADGGQGNHQSNGNDAPVSVQSDSGKLIVHNSLITIWFQGYKPVLHIFEHNASGNSTGFTVAINGVYEVNSTNAPVAVLPMTRAFPEIENMNNGPFNYSSGYSVAYNNTTKIMNITFSLTANELRVMHMPVSNDSAVPSDTVQWSNLVVGQASVAVVFHINATTANVKFDFLANQWTWLNNTSDKLALSAVVAGHQTVRDSSGQQPTDQGTVAGDNNNQATDSAQTAQAANRDNSPDNISIHGQNFINLGYVSWGAEANATYSNGTTTPVNVTVMMFSHGWTEEDYNYTGIFFIFNTPSGWNTNYTSLAYDPTIGLTLSSPSGISSGVVALGAVAGVVAAMAAIGAAVVLRRRK